MMDARLKIAEVKFGEVKRTIVKCCLIEEVYIVARRYFVIPMGAYTFFTAEGIELGNVKIY